MFFLFPEAQPGLYPVSVGLIIYPVLSADNGPTFTREIPAENPEDCGTCDARQTTLKIELFFFFVGAEEFVYTEIRDEELIKLLS